MNLPQLGGSTANVARHLAWLDMHISRRFHEDIVQEAVAGLIWFYLDLPADASRQEVEGCASQLINLIRSGSSLGALVRVIAGQQRDCFCMLGKPRAIWALAERSADLVRTAKRFPPPHQAA